MFKNKKPQVVVRCPWCFVKDIDAQLRYSSKEDLYYCLKCCYTAKKHKTAMKELNNVKKERYKSYY